MDMMHISKCSNKFQSSKVTGSYCYITGMDCSSSASIAAILNCHAQNVSFTDFYNRLRLTGSLNSFY